MTKTRSKFAVTSLAMALGITSLLSTPALAASNAALIQDALAPTVNAITSGGPNAYYNTWTRYVGSGTPKPGMGDQYIILGKGDAKSLTGRPYSFNYVYYDQFDQKKPSKLTRQGIAPTTDLGGSWMRRGDLRGFLPPAVSRLSDDTIVTNLQSTRALGRQVARIGSQTPEEKAASIVDLGTNYPVLEGSLSISQTTSGLNVYRWLTRPYTNTWGDTCDASEVVAFLQPQPGSAQLMNFDVNETNCRTSSGQPVATYNDGSVRPWTAIVGNAPQPNIALGG